MRSEETIPLLVFPSPHSSFPTPHSSLFVMADTRQPEPTMQSAVDRMMPSIASELEDAQKGRVRCIVVTPERAVLDEFAEMVILPMFDGELGVLYNRSPIIGRLGKGELRLQHAGQTKRFRVEGGFAQVRDNVVTVLTDRALKPGEIDLSAAQQRVLNSLLLAATPEDQDKQLKDADRARAQMRFAQAASQSPTL